MGYDELDTINQIIHFKSWIQFFISLFNKHITVMLTKERHGEHKMFDRKTYIFK